jgi:hypothetical protein
MTENLIFLVFAQATAELVRRYPRPDLLIKETQV